jgi:antitoxin component YwqK of YwqJK toxin-antitoxin module
MGDVMDTLGLFPIDIWVEIVDVKPRVYGVVSRLSRAHYRRLGRDLEHYKTASCELVINGRNTTYRLPNGHRHGKSILHDVNGQTEYNYVHDQLHGNCVCYSTSGRKTFECTHVNGKPHGIYKNYYLTGEQHYEVMYVEGKRQGKGYEYYRTGQIYKIYTYLDDVLNGEYTEYYSNDNVYIQCTYVNGDMLGHVECYYQTGVKMWEHEKTPDGIINKISYDINGNIIPD